MYHPVSPLLCTLRLVAMRGRASGAGTGEDSTTYVLIGYIVLIDYHVCIEGRIRRDVLVYILSGYIPFYVLEIFTHIALHYIDRMKHMKHMKT